MQDAPGAKPYKTVKETGESEIVISKSRFLGYCIPVSSPEAAAEELEKLRKRHWEARHVCYAFRLCGGVSRSSDDGEPSGTAGAPILNVLMQRGLENVLCAVVRYFGGVLLGTGGLVRAYGKAASEAAQTAGTLDYRVCEQLQFRVSYAAYAALEPLLKTLPRTPEAAFGEDVSLLCTLPAGEADAFLRAAADRTDGGAKLESRERALIAL